jgi:hypothetical protein
MIMPINSPQIYTPHDYGADPFGQSENSRHFQQCLDDAGVAAAENPKTVLVRPGSYTFRDGGIRIPPNVTLQGSSNGPVNHGTSDGMYPDITAPDATIFYIRYKDPLNAPFCRLNSNSAVRGITFVWPTQDILSPVPDPFPFAIGKDPNAAPLITNVNLENLEFLNADKAVDLTGCLRHTVRNIIGQAFSIGILVDQVRDVGRIENVQFHTLWSGVQFSGQSDEHIIYPPILLYQFNNSAAFKILRSDAQMVRNCFAYVYKYGLWLAKPTPGRLLDGPYGSFEGMSFDTCATALYLDGANVPGVQFTNTTILGARVLGINITGNFTSTVKFTNGCNGNGFGLGVLVNGGNVIFTNFQFADNDRRHASLVADATNPDVNPLSLLVQGCTFTKTLADIFPLHIDVRGSVAKALLIGNMFPGTAWISNLAQVAVTSLNA